jgi:hypothetical protein
MKTLTLALIVTAIVIVGLVILLEPFKTGTNAVIRLSVIAQTSPNNVKIHTQQQLTDIDNGVTILDDSTLDKLPVLKNAIDQAKSRFIPPPINEEHSFSIQITQGDADSIIQLAGNKVNRLPVTQFDDSNFGVNFTSYTSVMDFKLKNFYYHVSIEQLVPSQVTPSDIIP